MKTYQVRQTRKGRETIVEGTLDRLIEYYSYTLEVGASYNRAINRKPKTIRSFMTNLKKSLDEKEGSCYERTLVELV